jgi:FkbM family methyltransferase
MQRIPTTREKGTTLDMKRISECLAVRDYGEALRLGAKWLMFYCISGANVERYLVLRAKAAHLLQRVGIYERRHITVLSKFIREGDVVLDIGANYGAYTIAMSKLVGKTGKVIVFEPLEEVFTDLMRLTPGLSNVRYYNEALSSQESSQVEIRVPLLFGKIPEPALATLENIDPPYVSKTVRTSTLDSYFGELKGLRFMKVDIEGHEMSLFEGAHKVIESLRPIIQFEENNMVKAFGVYEAFAERRGYTLCKLNRRSELEVLKPSQIDAGDFNFYLTPDKNWGT